MNVLVRRLIQLPSKILLLNASPQHKSFLWALYQTEHFFDMLHLFYIFICRARLTAKCQEILTVSGKDCIYIRVEGKKILTGVGVSPHSPSAWLADVVCTPPSAAEVWGTAPVLELWSHGCRCSLCASLDAWISTQRDDLTESVMLERTESVFRHWKKLANLLLAVTAPIKDTKFLLWRILAEKYSSFIQSGLATQQKTAHVRLLIKTLPRCTGIRPGCGAALWRPDPPGVGVYTGCITLGMSPTTGAHWAPWRSRSTSHSFRARNTLACV